MPDDCSSDEALAAHLDEIADEMDRPAWVEANNSEILRDAAKRLIQLHEEKQAAEDMLEHARSLLARAVSGVLELDSFLRHRGR